MDKNTQSLFDKMELFTSCEKCHFWVEWLNERFGTCSRHSRTVYNKDIKKMADRYPVTSRHDSCGAGVETVIN